MPYEVVDGLAVHDGDIVLGTAEEMAATEAAATSRPERRELARPYFGSAFWPQGVVPYVIDEALPPGAAESVRAAIADWNAKTVITLAPRADETDYVRFVRSEVCMSSVGRIGGEQKVWSGGEGADCGPGGIAHEIGHAVGLHHEHQRLDRYKHLTVSDEDTSPRRRQSYALSSPPIAPYDFRSTMHYASNAFESIPPGIEIPSGGLSDGDVDGVARLYGQPPSATVIATNPPGLQVLVDDLLTTAPARFDWAVGTEHTVEVLAESQLRPGRRYLFGRWNDEAPRARRVTVGEDGTWLEANFIAQHRVSARADPPGTGSVQVSPTHEWHTARAEIRLEATPFAGMRFWSWTLPWGGSSTTRTRADAQLPQEIAAHFTTWPVFRIAGDVPAFLLHMDGALRAAPAPVAITPYRRTTKVRIEETQAVPGQPGSRYRFERWSDGITDREREIDLPKSDGELRAILLTEHSLWLAARPEYGGSVAAVPAPEDGYHSEGTAVTATATPNEGWELARWTGDASGSSPVALTVDAPSGIEAWFTRTRRLRPGFPEAVTLPTDQPGFRFAAPEGAAAIALKFAPDSPAPRTEMRVRALSGPLEPDRAAWERLNPRASRAHERLRDSDFTAPAALSALEVAISPYTDPPLDPDALYFVVLVSDGTPVSGTLNLEVTASGPRPPRAKAWPRAFTFVSDAGADPEAQACELRNEGGSAMQFDAASEAAWLAADPAQGSIPPGGTAEISVRVTGQVPADTHAATLDLSLDGPYGPLSQLRLPVTFVAVPPPATRAAE